MRQYLYALTFCTAAHLLPLLLFLRMFSLNWWTLPQSPVSFSFNETMFRQIEGVSMGSPLGPILANIFVGFHERRLFDRFPKPFIYLRYVDDTFVSFKSRSDALVFFDTLNQLHFSLSFTIEDENNGQLPFLVVSVERCDSSFLTSVYRKPTWTGLYLNWHSFAPKSRKLNLIRLSFLGSY